MRPLIRLAWTLAALSAIGSPAVAGQDEPLQHLEGSLFQMNGLGEITSTELGTFRLDSVGAGDLRVTPGTAELISSGTLEKSLGVANEAREVDLVSGRPLRAGGTTCETGDTVAEPDCLPGSHCLPTATGPDPLGECDVSADVNAFRAINGVTIGAAASLDPAVGTLTIYNSFQNLFTGAPATDPLTQPTLASLLSGLVAANTGALGFASAPQAFDVEAPVVRLNRDAGDTTPGAGFFATNASFDTLNQVLTPTQQALLGCGPFYGGSGGADCDVSGISLLLTEAGAFLGASPSLHGLGDDWDLTDPTTAQPGTVGFDGASVCERPREGGAAVLPGCRGPGDPLYDAAVDGTTTGLVIPFFDPSSAFYRGPFDLDGNGIAESPNPAFDATFESEFAAVAWNAQMLLVMLSSSNVAEGSPDQLLDPDDPFRQGGCSFASPQLCVAAQVFRSLVAHELGDDPSGPPRSRWVWETGSEHFQTDDATGGLADFAGWTFHALGPESSRRDPHDEAGVLFVLGPPSDLGAIPDSPLVVRGPGPDGVVGTADDPVVGFAYGVVPEPSPALVQLVGLLAAVGVTRCRRQRWASGGAGGASRSQRVPFPLPREARDRAAGLELTDRLSESE